MINFTGILKIGEDYINTQAVNDWHYGEKGKADIPGTYLMCRDGRGKFIEDVSPIDFNEKFAEAEKTGFSVIA